MQNFSEDDMLEHVLSGSIRLPAADVPTPFLDTDDVADVAVAALTDDRHVGQRVRAGRSRHRHLGSAERALAAEPGREEA
jgi:uncharacterized protein YbjT (DUF2867 family)